MRQKNTTLSTVIRHEVRSDGERSYDYELTVSENTRIASYGIPLYSIEVRMTDADGKTTTGRIKEAFADGGKALLFFDRIVKNLATPIDLAYILEDGI